MTQFGSKPRIWHKLIQVLSASRFGHWLLADNLHKIDRPVLRLSGGRVSLTSILSGLPVVVLTAKGAKSGLPRSIPIAAMRDGSRIILIASAFGKPRHPSWYHNLKANPDAQVQIDGTNFPCRAFEAEGEERARYWGKAVEMYAGFGLYAKKALPRRIPVIVLEVEGL
jgi:deazaflavin-dependent oxidoreductase (nitroreductase family)